MDRFSRVLRSPRFPVVLILFMQSCSIIGLVKAMGILFRDLSKSIEMTSADLGTTLGLLYTVGLLSTPIIAFVIKRTSNLRYLMITGAIIGSSPVILASRSTSNWHLFVAFGISGIGLYILRMACLTAMDRFAGDYFNLLYSLSSCGYSAGMVLFPFLADKLLKYFDWRGVLLILGILMMCMLAGIACVFAILVTVDGFKAAGDEDEMERCDQADDTIYEAESNGCSSGETTGKGPCDDVADTDPLLTPSNGHDRVTVDQACPNRETIPTNHLDCVVIIARKVSFWIRNIGFYDDPFSLFIFLSVAVFFFVYNGWHDFLVPKVLQHGISQEYTVIVTFVAAVGNFSVRLIIAALTHNSVDPINIHLFLTFLNVISVTCDVFIPHYYIMLMTSFCSAAALAGRACLGILIIRNRFSSENLPIVLSMNNIVEAFGFFLGGYLSGFVADKFSSYDATFKLLASVDVLTFAFMLFPKMKKKPQILSDVEN
ncbi:monocarboxylate transporter 6-like [Lytechinus pictus]|uniref:monocarboxylate transporter 6-like n=1 Tax=Lytechinus pictus TaxID=7653 RepID=UPI0030B9B219